MPYSQVMTNGNRAINGNGTINGNGSINGGSACNGRHATNGVSISNGKVARNGGCPMNGVNGVNGGNWVAPNRPRKCTWQLGTTEKSPHAHYRVTKDKMTRFDSILDSVGDTPLVRMTRLEKAEGLKCELYAKCEFMNPGGSVKDRIAMRMIEDAERDGRLKPGCGYTIIEPTSGNTGIGLALVAAIKGYRCVIVIPDRMSEEKINVLAALGAEIVRVRSSAKIHEPDSHVRTAYRLHEEIENSVVLQQYVTSGNPVAHYDTTAEEILEQCGGNLDMVVAGTGTGGTISGIGRKMKEKCPKCQVVGVDPYSSIIAQPDSINVTKVRGVEMEGMGHDFVPTTTDRSVIDKWYKTTDEQTFVMARRLIKEEGLLCGGSSGANVYAAVELCRDLEEGQKCVVILPDSIRNYMTRYLMDNWMIERNYMPEETINAKWWWSHPVTSLEPSIPVSILPTTTCIDAINIMKQYGFDQIPVVTDKGEILGVVIMKKLMMSFASGKIRDSDTVENNLLKKVKKVSTSHPLKRISRLLEDHDFVLVTHDQPRYLNWQVVRHRDNSHNPTSHFTTRDCHFNFESERQDPATAFVRFKDSEFAGLDRNGELLKITDSDRSMQSEHLYGIVTVVDFCEYLAKDASS